MFSKLLKLMFNYFVRILFISDFFMHDVILIPGRKTIF